MHAWEGCVLGERIEREGAGWSACGGQASFVSATPFNFFFGGVRGRMRYVIKGGRSLHPGCLKYRDFHHGGAFTNDEL